MSLNAALNICLLKFEAKGFIELNYLCKHERNQ